MDQVLRSELDILWTCVAAFLVFLMQAGFAYVEAGFTRARNVVNILMKNLSDAAVGGMAFYLVGFAIMFGPQLWTDFGFGKAMPADSLLSVSGKPDSGRFAFFLFQMMFCATSVTIASGAMAERTKFHSYLIYSVVISAIIYPVFGSLAWADLFTSVGAKGYLAQKGFIDFAGSTVVHSLGGWLGLAGTIVLGPRRGKFDSDGSINPLFGHNMAMATMGGFLLWFGWFGFNAGSTTSVAGGSLAIIAVTTHMAAAAGALGALLLSWFLFRKSDITMVINGALAGLVAITAPCFNVSIPSAILIGLVAGIIVVGSVIALDHLHIDDPVGAVSVHGVAGAWGTLAVGLFAQQEFGGGPNGLFFGGGWKQLLIQAEGVGLGFVWAFGAGLILFYLLHFSIGLRVSVDAELEGLDIAEHGVEGYPEQQQ